MLVSKIYYDVTVYCLNSFDYSNTESSAQNAKLPKNHYVKQAHILSHTKNRSYNISIYSITPRDSIIEKTSFILITQNNHNK